MKTTTILTALVSTGTAISIISSLSASAYDADRRKKQNNPLESATKLIDEGRRKEALPLLDEAIRRQPLNALAYLGRARAYEELGMLDQAQRDARSAYALEPRNPWAMSRLATISERFGNYSKALSYVDAAIHLDPHNQDLYVARANIYIDLRKYEAALRDANVALTWRPKDSLALYRRARAYIGLGKEKLALTDLQKCISMDPRSYYIRELGDLYASKQNYAAALKVYKLGSEKYPTDGMWYSKMAATIEKTNHNLHKAEQLYDKAIELSPDDAFSYASRADILLHTGRFHGALRDSEKAIAMSPNEPLFYFRRASAFSALGHYQQAKRDLDRAISYNKRYYFLAARAEAYMRLGEYARAVDDATAALKLAPRDRGTMLLRSSTYAHVGQYEQSLSDYLAGTVQEKNTDRVDLSTIKQVTAGYTDILKLTPDDITALYNRGIAYLCMRKPQLAGADLDKFVHVCSFPYAKTIGACCASLAYREAGQADNANRILEFVATPRTGRSVSISRNGSNFSDGTASPQDHGTADMEHSTPPNFRVPFPESLLRYLQGHCRAAQVLASALRPDDRTRAQCYIGIDLVLRNRANEAKPYLQAVLKTGDSRLDEYALAQSYLNR